MNLFCCFQRPPETPADTHCSCCFSWSRWTGYSAIPSAVDGPLSLSADERAARSSLLQSLENGVSGDSMAAFLVLAYSENLVAQQVAAQALVEITERHAAVVSVDVIDCNIRLLQSTDAEVLRAAAAALGNLAVVAENQLIIVERDALPALISIMASADSEVQCNAAGCITNLATHDSNKDRIAMSGALAPLTKLAVSSDLRIQRNATGALLNMTHTADNRMQLVAAGAIPILVQLLNSPDYDVQYYSTTSLSNIAVDYNNRKLLAVSEPNIVPFLVRLTDSPSLKVQCQATLALRNLASDELFQLQIVEEGGLKSLNHLLHSGVPQIILAAVACIRNVSIHSQNEIPIIEANFLNILLDLLSVDNHEIQCHAISTIRNLASTNENKQKIFEAGAIEKIGELLRLQDGIVDTSVKSELAATLAVLALLDKTKPSLVKILKYLIRLTGSSYYEVKTNAAVAIGNCVSYLDPRGIKTFIKYWKEIRLYILSFISSNDSSLRHIGVWTLVQCITGNEHVRQIFASDSELLGQIASMPKSSQKRRQTEGKVGIFTVTGDQTAEELSRALLHSLKAD